MTELAIPAHGTITLSPSGNDVVLIGGPRLLASQQVPLTLTSATQARS